MMLQFLAHGITWAVVDHDKELYRVDAEIPRVETIIKEVTDVRNQQITTGRN